MKLFSRGAVIIGIIIGLMGAVQAQDNIVEDEGGNAVQTAPPELETAPDIKPEPRPQIRPEVKPAPATVPGGTNDIPVDWLLLLAGGGIALLLVQLANAAQSRHETHKDLQAWFTKWSIDECIEPLLVYLEAINLHFAKSMSNDIHIEDVPPIPFVAFHRLRVITNTPSIAHIILALEPWSKNKVSPEEYKEVAGVIAKFRNYLLELEGYLLETSIRERSDVLELRHKKEVVSSLAFLNALKAELQTVGVKYGRLTPPAHKAKPAKDPKPPAA